MPKLSAPFVEPRIASSTSLLTVPTLLKNPSRKLIFSVTFFSAIFAGCSKPASTGARPFSPPPVVVTKVVRKTVPLTLDAIGAVEPSRTAGVRSQVTGNLLKIDFTEGADVKEGDLMFEIDPRPFRNAVAAAEADIQKTQAQLENARTQVKRYETLSDASMVSKEQYQTIQVNERAVAAQLLSNQSALANAKLQLEFCSIRAPISGRTGAVGAHEGDLVRASDANVSLVTINQLSPINVTFSVPQDNLAQISQFRAKGKIFATAIPGGAVNLLEKGELNFVDNVVDTTTGTVRLKALFPNEDHGLWPGQFVTVSITLSNPEVTVIPSAALQTDQKGQHVFVIKSDKTAEYRIVTVERTVGPDAVITSGLNPGETVVVDGQLRVVVGSTVEIKPPAGPPPSSNPISAEASPGDKAR